MMYKMLINDEIPVVDKTASRKARSIQPPWRSAGPSLADTYISNPYSSKILLNTYTEVEPHDFRLFKYSPI